MTWLAATEWANKFSEVRIHFDTNLDTQPYIEGDYKGVTCRENVFGHIYYVHNILCSETNTMYVLTEDPKKENLFKFIELNQRVRVTPTYYSYEIQVQI